MRFKNVNKEFGAFLVLGSLALIGSGTALAQTTITVNDLTQVSATTCTLSNAIVSANKAAAAGGCVLNGSGAPYTIQLQNQTYVMSAADNYWYGPNALPPIAGNIVIEGNGATLAVTDPSIVRLRFFYVGADPAAPGTLNFNTPGAGKLTLHNLTLSGGKQKGGNGDFGGGGAGMGGAIFSQGSLTLSGVTLSGNSAKGGSSNGFGGVDSNNGGGMGSDATALAGGGFGGPVTPAGSSGGIGGGGGGGFAPSDNGIPGGVPNGGKGGGTPDGLGGPGGGGNTPQNPGGNGSGAGASDSGPLPAGIADGGGFGVGGSTNDGGGPAAGGGVGGGGSGPSSQGGGGGGFGGGGGRGHFVGGFGGFGGGSGAGLHQLGAGFGGGVSGRSFRCGGGGAGFGGAIFVHGGNLTVTNSTLAGNTAQGGTTDRGGAGHGLGGAIFSLNGTVTIRFSTLAENTVLAGAIISEGQGGRAGSGQGGAVYSLGYNLQTGQGATLTVSNSILSNSIGGNDLVVAHTDTVSNGAVNVATSTGTFQDQNIIPSFATANGYNGPAPLSADPQLSALALNAPGLTATMAIANTSPAFNAGVCEPAITAIDQSGTPRPQGAGCDVGAYELIQTSPVTINSSPAGLGFTSGGFGCAPGAYTAGATLQWEYGVSCTVTFANPQSAGGGFQYVFSGWEDNYALNPRVFSTPTAASTYTADFRTSTNTTPASATAAYNPAAQTVTLTAAVTSVSPVNAGTVTFTVAGIGTTAPATVTNGSASATLNIPAGQTPGLYTIGAAYSGTASLAPSSGTQTFNIDKRTQTIAFAAIASQVQGKTLTLSATASSALAVTFTTSTPAICTVSGATATMVTAGTCTIVASQAGNAVYAAAIPVSQSFTVQAAFTLTPLPASETVFLGQAAVFAVELHSTTGFTGTITLSCSGGPLGSKCTDLPRTVRLFGGYGIAFSGILFPENTPPGTYTMTITGTSGAISNSTTAQFIVKSSH